MNSSRPRLGQEIVFVALLFVVALGVRIYRLPQFPPGLWLDEAANGLDIFDILQGHTPIFFERNNGREPLFLYWQAAVIAVVGASPFALRLAAALVGAATIPATYFMVRTLFRNSDLPASWVAGWTALFLTFSYWHLALSRLGLRAIMLPLLAALTFTCFWRAWQHLRSADKFPWFDLVLCGATLGLSLYTYTASRFLPILVLITVVTGLVLTWRTGLSRWQPLWALGVIGLTALLVFAPLGYHFLTYPEHFSGRAAEISIFNPDYGGANPLGALGEAATKTALMFFTTPDPNLRHNPAARPVFDLLLAFWLLVGIGVALIRWRNLPYLFMLFWLGVLALPALLSVQGAPHSLRSIGVLPVAILLPVVGMLWVGGRRLPGRLAWLALWLPLPFLIFSSVTSVRDYFLAWRDLEKFRTPFLLDYYDVGQRIAQHSAPDSVWVLPISPNYRLLDGMFPPFYTIEFLVRTGADYGSVPGDEARGPQRLAELTKGRRYVNLFRILDAPFFSEAPFVFDDTKNLVEFLLKKYGRLHRTSDGADIGMPYTVYEVGAETPFSVAEGTTPTEIFFADQVKLVGVDYGRTALELAEPATALSQQTLPAGHMLWAVLRWQAQTPLDSDLKTSLLLRDKAGHLAGQVDNLLVGDRYPVVRRWEGGEGASTYHTLPTLAAIPPGVYHLYLKVYEEATGRIYTARSSDGQLLGAEAYLGEVAITPSLSPATLAPTQPLPEQPQLAPGLRLTGFDLSRTIIAPGDRLPLTLYWQANAPITENYAIALQLLDQAGAVAVERVSAPGNGAFPTGQWRADESLRDWQDLSTPPDLPTGLYTLTLNVQTGGEAVGGVTLGEIQVSGRPRLFTAPPIAQPVEATFGQQVRLLGVDAEPEFQLVPGQTLTFTLIWQPLATAPAPLVRFVHLRGVDGRPVAQQDTVPCHTTCPATSWLADEILLDEVVLTVPPDLAAGSYQLGVGWYVEATQERLAAVDAGGYAPDGGLVALPVVVEVR